MRAGIDNLFRSQPDIDEFIAPLRLKTAFQPLIDRFPKGIDNTHLDVALSPEFTSRTQLMVRRSLLHDVTENYWGESPPAPDNKDVQYFREGYTGMMELAVDQARKHIRLELIQLLQFSVIKFLMSLPACVVSCSGRAVPASTSPVVVQLKFMSGWFCWQKKNLQFAID